MRSAVLALAVLAAACQPSSQTNVRRDDPLPVAGNNTSSDEPTRGVEGTSALGDVPPASGGVTIPGTRAAADASRTVGEKAAATPPEATLPSDGDPRTALEVEYGPCSRNEDCTTTRVPRGSCCATLCEPRAILKARADALAVTRGDCGQCQIPLCKPVTAVSAPACVAGRCAMVQQR